MATKRKQKVCTCEWIAPGHPMLTIGCKIHDKTLRKRVKKHTAYPCNAWIDDHKCTCNDYRPVSKPDQDKGGWPYCICGHIAQAH